MNKTIPGLTLKGALLLRKRKGSPRIIKSHHPFDSNYKKIIYILRDPRDVLVSYYFYQIRQGRLCEEISFKKFVKDYYLNYDIERTWRFHVYSWLFAQKDPSFDIVLVKYESMLENPCEKVKKIVNFSGLKKDSSEIKKAVKASSFSNLKEMEEKERENGEEKPRFYRKGTSNQWKKHFDQETHNLFLKRAKPVMLRVGYDNF